MTEIEVARMVFTGVQILISFATSLGFRDAAITALDSALGAARANTDRDLERKHREPA